MAARILVVDDEAFNVDLLCQELDDLDYTYATASNGLEAITLLGEEAFDAVLLDMMMPVMNGMEVLQHLNSTGKIFEVPVIVVSALDDIDHITKSLELGAEDYLQKPIDENLLKARLAGALEKKSLRDQVARQLKLTTDMFGKFVPTQVASALVNGDGQLAPIECEASIMFCDMEGFTTLAESIQPSEVLRLLTEYYMAILPVVEKHLGVVNEFHGDGLFVVFNAPLTLPDHAKAAVNTAFGILETLDSQEILGRKMQARIGIATGWVIAGNIVTKNQFNYSVMGDTVNLAARLEKKNKELGSRLLISQRTAEYLDERSDFEEHNIALKGKVENVTVYKYARSS